jgi:hypothetical protein
MTTETRVDRHNPYDGDLKTYVEPNSDGGWSWGIYEVPVNRGLTVQGFAWSKWTAELALRRAVRQVRTIGFRGWPA